MVSIIATQNLAVKSCHFDLHLRFPLVSSIVVGKRRRGSALVLTRISGFPLREVGKCVCCKGWESGGEQLTLEGEILEFMKKSNKPNDFPTKKELVEAGRMDLVEGIVKEGGWLSLGWELDEGNEELENDVDVEDFRTVGSFQESNSFVEEDGASCFRDGCGSLDSSSPPASPSGRALDVATNEDSGIEGILCRLEKQRNLSLGIDLGKSGYETYVASKDGRTHQFRGSTDPDRANRGENPRCLSVSPSKSLFNEQSCLLSHNGSLLGIDDSRNSVKPDAWRTWSIQRAGSNTEFEAGEIYLQTKGKEDDSRDETVALSQDNAKKYGEIDLNNIRSRLQHLERELSASLCSLRSKSVKLTLEGHESVSSDMQELSDAWEFQENDFTNARDRLRSIRAKLAVLEGKMTLAVIDAQKIVEEKQKRIAGAQRALQLLRNTCIVWPSSASEVLLAGSFDGWSTQRKMEKSRTGIFSVYLHLYPGRYEIKFIVDGEWRLDPLRPIVNSSGHENNLLLIE